MSIILIHELGHILCAYIFKWNIDKIIILPFGALTIFNEKINKPLFEEFMILITGPLFQIIGTYILYKNNNEILNYSKIILFFNLLPIYPLDGSKLLNIILNKITSFEKSHLVTIYVSLLFIFLLIFKLNLILLFIILFISLEVIKQIKDHKNIFNKFLLERYLYNFNFKKVKNIKNIKQMKRDYKHIIKNKTEKEILKQLFDFQRKT